MRKWAYSTPSGATENEFQYKENSLVVYIRRYTSGVATSEPVVFLKRGTHWGRILSARKFEFTMSVSIQGNMLIFWHHKGDEKSECLRFNLDDLDLLR
jgi:hypothetical protein